MIEQQLAAELLGPRGVALIAMFDQQGANLLLEQFESGIVGRGNRPGGECPTANAKTAKFAKDAESQAKNPFAILAAFAPFR
jgi:hypothetical protein